LHSWVARDREGFDNAATALAGADDARETLLYTEEPALPMALPDGFIPVVDLVRAADHVAPLVARLLRGAVLVADRAAAMRAVGDYPDLRAVTPAGEIITAVSYRGGKAADALLEVQARIRDVESALEHERQAALLAADEVDRHAAQRSLLVRERQAILGRIDALRTAAAQAAGALAAAGEAVQREAHQEAQLRQQLVRIGGLVEQAEQLRVAAQGRQGTVAEAETATTDEERRRWLEQAETLLAELSSLEAAQLPDGASLTALEAQLREDEQANVTLQVELAHADDACAAAAGEREATQAEVERCA